MASSEGMPSSRYCTPVAMTTLCDRTHLAVREADDEPVAVALQAFDGDAVEQVGAEEPGLLVGA